MIKISDLQLCRWSLVFRRISVMDTMKKIPGSKEIID